MKDTTRQEEVIYNLSDSEIVELVVSNEIVSDYHLTSYISLAKDERVTYITGAMVMDTDKWGRINDWLLPHYRNNQIEKILKNI